MRPTLLVVLPALVLTTTIAATGTAAAGDSAATPLTASAPSLVAHEASSVPAAAPPAPRQKSPAVARALSIGVTAASLGLFAAAGAVGEDNTTAASVLAAAGLGTLFAGPTAGHWYAGRKVTTGLAVRLVGLGIAGLVVSSNDKDDFAGSAGSGVVLGVTALIGAAMDFATTSTSVRRFNQRAGGLGVAPLRSSAREPVRGIAVQTPF